LLILFGSLNCADTYPHFSRNFHFAAADDPEAGKGSGYNIFNEVSSGLMFGVGCLYFLMGVACMQTVKEAETRQLSSGQLSDEDD
jgi:hypothetical protein